MRAGALEREVEDRPGLDVRTVVTDVTAQAIARLDARDEHRSGTHDDLVAQMGESLVTFPGDAARLAVLCAWGVDAEAAYRAAAVLNRRVPVAALAAGTLSEHLWPGLTYSRLPLEEGGREAARLILAASREASDDSPHTQILLAPSLRSRS